MTGTFHVLSRWRRLAVGCALGLTIAAAIVASAPAGRARQSADSARRAGAAPHYLFSTFRDNGQDGLHLAHSRDGLKWSALNGDRSFLTPTIGTKLMRDPSIVRGPNGMFHLVWTTGWWDRGIGVAHSKDLITWSEQRSIPVMEHEPTAVNCWAPELFYDDATKQYLIFWSTTIPGRFPKTDDSGDPGNSRRLNHRMYYVTTKDFQSYSETKLFYDGGFNVIDGTIAKDGDRYVLIAKDETKSPVAKKHLRLAMGSQAIGPYGPAGEPITPDWVEGPSVLKLGSAWVVYFDEYTRKRYGAIRTTDWKTWTNISDQIDLPAGTRHGTAFQVPEEIATVLMKIAPH